MAILPRRLRFPLDFRPQRTMAALVVVAGLALTSPLAQSARPILETGEPGTAREDGRLLVALPLSNNGLGAAENVVLTRISLNGQSPVRPARLPASVGDLPSGGELVVQLAFSLGGLEREPRFRLEIEGRYGPAGRQRSFSLAQSVDRPLPEEGERRSRRATAEPRLADGAIYPPQELEREFEVEPTGRPLPESLRPSVAGPDNSGVEVVGTPGAVPLGGTAQADTDVSFVRISNEPLTFTDTKGGSPWDPSGASVDHAKGEKVVFLTGNLYALLSLDGGATFRHIDPTTIFGNVPRDGLPEDEGLCCDMNMIYIPGIDRFVWVLLTKGSVVGSKVVAADGQLFKRVPINGLNRLRVATATTQQVISSGGTSWTYWDMTTKLLGLGDKAFLDYPDVTFTDQSLHISITDTSASGGFFVMRVPLSDVQSGGTIHISHTDPADGACAFSARLAHDVTDAAYWFCHVGTAFLGIFEWLDNSGSYTWRMRSAAPWSLGTFTSMAPDGTNWLAANTTAIRGATVQSDAKGTLRQMLVAWNVASGGSFPQPYVRLVPVARLTLSSGTQWQTGQSMQIWNPTLAFNHAHLSTNANGEIGVSVGAGGPGSHATPVAGFVGDATLYVSGVSTTSLTRYGDYTAIRPHRPNAKLFMVTDYFLQGAPDKFTVWHQYRLFGRSGDM